MQTAALSYRTVNSVNSTWRRFLRFQRRYRLELARQLRPPPGLADEVLAFASAGLIRGSFRACTAAQYIKNLRMVLDRTPASAALRDVRIDDFLRGITKLGNRQETTPQKFLTLPLLRLALRNPSFPASVRAAMLLMWASAARHASISWLRPVDIRMVRRVPQGAIIDLCWPRSKTDPTGQGRHQSIQVPSEFCDLLLSQLLPTGRHLRPHDPLFPETYHEFMGYVKQLHPELGSRSWRKGAVRALVEKGLSLRAVARVSGHADPQNVFRYGGLQVDEARQAGLRASAALFA